MDLESLFSRSPIIYTTRLDEMTILRQNLRKFTPRDIIETIIHESKPYFKARNNVKTSNIKLDPQENNDDITINEIVEFKPNSKLTFKNLKSKLNKISSKLRNFDNETQGVNKSTIDTDNKDYGPNKLESLLALCKPLKVVLEDINKRVPKAENDIKMEILNISSDSDDDDTNGEDRISVTKMNTSTDKQAMARSAFYTIKNINELKNILNKEILQNSVLVIYNRYRNDFDAYQIDQMCNVTEHKTRNCTEVYKFPEKKCKMVINIIACCWKNRQSYVSFLLSYKEYNDIARFIHTAHPCPEICACCCCLIQTRPKPQESQNKNFQINITDTDSLISGKTPSKSNSKLIEMALRYDRSTKHKEHSGDVYTLNNENKPFNQSCNTLLEIKNSNGPVEYYELGRDNLIYSKVVKTNINDTSWLFKTLSQCDNRIKYSYTYPPDRERKIMTYRQFDNIISYNTERFLKNATTEDVAVTKKTKNNADIGHVRVYKIEHTRSFMETINNKCKVLSIASEISKNKISPRPFPVSPTKQSIDDIEPVPKVRRQKSKSRVMEEQVSETVNGLIKDILHRFRNVLLTINSDGKVSAALNAPLSSLTHSELKILSEILSHAQSQVDKLGLTPGTCLNPDASMFINLPPNISTNSNNTNTSTCEASTSTASNNFKNSNMHKNLFSAEEKKNNKTKIEQLSRFSKMTANKKREYGQSFRSYLGICTEEVATPKITNVFSINNVNSDNQNTPLEESADVINVYDDSNVSNEHINSNNTLTDFELNEARDGMTVLDSKVQLTRRNKRKQNITLKENTKPAKIRVKSTAEFFVEDSTSVETQPLYHNLQILPSDENQPGSFPTVVTSETNYVTDDNVIKKEPESFEVSPFSEQVVKTEPMTYSHLGDDGIIIKNECFPVP